jgi:hypothetical protein
MVSFNTEDGKNPQTYTYEQTLENYKKAVHKLINKANKYKGNKTEIQDALEVGCYVSASVYSRPVNSLEECERLRDLFVICYEAGHVAGVESKLSEDEIATENNRNKVQKKAVANMFVAGNKLFDMLSSREVWHALSESQLLQLESINEQLATVAKTFPHMYLSGDQALLQLGVVGSFPQGDEFDALYLPDYHPKAARVLKGGSTITHPWRDVQ